MTTTAPHTPSPVLRAVAACGLACTMPAAHLAAESLANPTGGGASITLEPVPAPPRERARRPVFVCRDGAGVVFSDRPCGQVVEARVIEVLEPGPGQVATTARKVPTAAVRPRAEPVVPDHGPARADGRCARLRAQLEALDDRMRTGYSAREAARLWNRWREIKAQIHDARC